MPSEAKARNEMTASIRDSCNVISQRLASEDDISGNATGETTPDGVTPAHDNTPRADGLGGVATFIDAACSQLISTLPLTSRLSLGGSQLITPEPRMKMQISEMMTRSPLHRPRYVMEPRAMQWKDSIPLGACENSLVVAEHPGEIPLPLWNLDSCKYWKSFYDDYAMDSMLELGRQKRPWNVLSGCTGSFTEGAIFEVFTIEYYN